MFLYKTYSRETIITERLKNFYQKNYYLNYIKDQRCPVKNLSITYKKCLLKTWLLKL